jgi:Tol biopolymer transport system component
MKLHQFIVVVLVFTFIGVSSGYAQQTAEQLYQSGLYKEEIKGELDSAIKIYETIINQYPENRSVAAKTQLHIGLCYEKLGNAQARKAYERVVNEYTDQSDIVAQAKVRLAILVSPGDKKGFATRRILKDASAVGDVLTTDGKYIRGLNRETGDLYQFEIASGQTSLIKNKGPWGETDMDFNCQVLSQDGKQIVYDSFKKDWVPQVVIRNLDGSEVRTLYSEKDSYVYPYDWSPDGGFILALRSKNDITELTLISTLDGSIHAIRSIPSQMFMFDKANFSLDGRFVAFSFVRDGNPPHGDVFLMTANGQNEIVVAGHPSEDRLVGWAPDGKSLIFLSDRSGSWDIWTVHIAGGKQKGEPELLKKDFGYYSNVLGIAPDGSFYYKVNTPSGGLYRGALDIETGKVVVSPSPVTTRYTGTPFNLMWSADGKYLLYLSRRGSIGPGNNILTIRSDATGEERFLSPPLRFVNQMSWAPDGRSIFAIGITEKETGIYRIDAETSATTRMKGLNGLVPRLCPDGKTLVFVKGGIMAITKLNLDTEEESEVVRNASLSYDISPDGQKAVFYNYKDSTIKTVPLSGGEPKDLARGLSQHYRLMWTKDGRYIIARALNAQTGDNSKIWRIPAQGGTPLKLDLSVPNMMFFALHPDNSHFVFSVSGETKSELWIMENFLPK